MKRFEFKEHGYPLPLDIAGHMFTLNVTKETSLMFERYGRESQRFIAEVGNTPDAEEKAWRFAQNMLDEVLGIGATDAIFAGRDRDLLDIADIIAHIGDEIEQAARAQQETMRRPDMPVPGAPQQTVEQALRIMQNPEVMSAISKAMGQV